MAERTAAEIVKNPHSLSELIDVGISDLRGIIYQEGGYYPAFSEWHSVQYNSSVVRAKLCYVCLAGAVLARTFGAPANRTVWPHDFCADSKPFYALDDIRNGNYRQAYLRLFPDRGGSDVELKLDAIEPPRDSDFMGEDEARMFVDSLEKINNRIREIEEAVKP